MKKLLCCWLVMYALTAFSQQLSITNYSAKEGAPPLGGTHVYQDSNGWLWFTDGENLIKYDGNQFKNIPASFSCKTEFVYRVFQVENEIWAMATPYVVKIKGDSLVPVELLPQKLNLINQIRLENEIYFLGEKGLYLYQQNRFLPYIIDSSLRLRSESASLVSWNDSLILTYDLKKSLLIFDLKKRQLFRIPAAIIDLREYYPGSVYALTNESLLRIDRIYSSNGMYHADQVIIPLKIQLQNPKMFLIDKLGNIWILDQYNKLVRRTPEGKWFSYTELDGLPGLWFNYMMLDRENNLWIVFNGAISKINYLLWNRYTVQEGLYSNIISSFSRQTGKVFINTASGVNLFTENEIVRLVNANNIPFQCSDMAFHNGNLYYVRKNHFYTAVLNAQNKIVNERNIGSLPETTSQLVVDSKGNIFIATQNGVFIWNGNELRKAGTDDKFIHRLFLDRTDHLWTGEYGGGLHRYSLSYTNNEVRLQHQEYIEHIQKSLPPLFQIRSISEDVNGNIFAGTRYNGLFIMKVKNGKTELINHFDKTNGLKSNAIWSLASDRLGNTWIATGNGLQSISEENDQWKLQDENLKRQIYHINNVLADSNSLWLSSQPGVVKFSISDKEYDSPFRVELSSIRSGNKTISPGTKKLPFRSNNLTFEFSANSFLDERNILYSYRMLGTTDTNWSKPERLHTVYYSSLRPGKYGFQVKAINVDGRPSSNYSGYSFTIMKPFWQTGWFIGLLALPVVVLLYLFYRYRIKQIIRLQQMRNNISRNLHDDIGASLSNINILNELAKRNANDTGKLTSYLEKAGDDIQHISESLSDIVWNINPKYDDLDNLFIRMKRYAADMLDGKGIKADLVFPVDHQNKMTMAMDKRRDFYLIFKEALNNLVKYSESENALLAIEFSDHSIHMIIKDDGKGFDLEKAKGGNGIQNMFHRAAAWKAPLIIDTSPGRGTLIKIEMKLD